MHFVANFRNVSEADFLKIHGNQIIIAQFPVLNIDRSLIVSQCFHSLKKKKKRQTSSRVVFFFQDRMLWIPFNFACLLCPENRQCVKFFIGERKGVNGNKRAYVGNLVR